MERPAGAVPGPQTCINKTPKRPAVFQAGQQTLTVESKVPKLYGFYARLVNDCGAVVSLELASLDVLQKRFDNVVYFYKTELSERNELVGLATGEFMEDGFTFSRRPKFIARRLK